MTQLHAEVGVRQAGGMSAESELVAAIRDGLRELAEPQRAPQMQAYMKSSMPYLGVRVPQVRALVRALVRTRPPGDTTALVATVRALWDSAEYREERYAATGLAGAPAVRRLRRPQLIDLYRDLIVNGAWWDHVDEVSHRVGELLLDFPGEIRPVVAGWQRSPDLWLRRASIICQLGFRSRTDVLLLTDAIEANATDREFFIRKAIGWALREYARTNPDWVREFVSTHELSPLSVREATKHL
jgi:3-methyladenine DNA glycosylase AlkD